MGLLIDNEVSRDVVLVVKDGKVEETDEVDFFEKGVVVPLRQLLYVRFGGVVEAPFGKVTDIFLLHLDDKRVASLVGRFYIQDGLFEFGNFRDLVGVGQRHIDNNIFVSEIQNGIEKGDEDVFVLLVSEDFLEGQVVFGVGKFHARSCEGMVMCDYTISGTCRRGRKGIEGIRRGNPARLWVRGRRRVL